MSFWVQPDICESHEPHWEPFKWVGSHSVACIDDFEVVVDYIELVKLENWCSSAVQMVPGGVSKLDLVCIAFVGGIFGKCYLPVAVGW